ncbi:hypothetical protein C6497_02300 [Candidatus Poribacteria bacterium]|nr:MAG: hypothetical protein C6497_02300 [Candidatus Poribacteria bacterium]
MRFLILLWIFCISSTGWSDIQFEDVSHQAGITRVGESWGNAWGDFDGDGYLDLWATNHKHKPSLYRNNQDGTFTDIIDQVWDAYPFADTHGVAWADFDNDGDQDLVVLCGGGGGVNQSNITHFNHFYVNENGRLIERASAFGIDMPLLRGRTPLWFDWNNDGHLDLLLTGISQKDNTSTLVKPSIFAQTQQEFENVNTHAGFCIDKGANLAQLGDITNDGNMDLFIGKTIYPEHIFDISILPFNDITELLSFPKTYNVQDATLVDLNGDLHIDAFLACGVYRSFIDTSKAESIQEIGDYPYKIKLHVLINVGEKGLRFKTDGAVKFEVHSDWASQFRHLVIGKQGSYIDTFGGEFIQTDRQRNVSSFTFVLDPTDTRTHGLADRPKIEKWRTYVGYNPDTFLWTVLYHTMPSSNTTWTGFEALISSDNPILDVEPINFTYSDLIYQPNSVLCLGNSSNHIKKIAFPDAVEARSIAAGDFDNDMDVDLYIVRSNSAINLPNQMYENQGNGTFIKLMDAGGAIGSKDGRGMSVTMADYDLDGYLDLFVTNGRGVYPFNNGPDQLFRNLGSGNNWIQIDLQGTVSNRDGIGAKVFATTPDGNTQLRERNGGIHWAQQDQKRIHFGLAQNQKVSELIIYWPSGILQKLNDIPVNQVLLVVEKGNQNLSSGDVNLDGKVDILDLLTIIAHFNSKLHWNYQYDLNRDGRVDLEDVVYVIEKIEEQQAASAPSVNSNTRTLSRIYSSLSEVKIALLHSFYEKIEELPGDITHKVLIKKFIENLLMPSDGPMLTELLTNYPNPFNPETWIPYQLSEDAEISIKIYNTTGDLINTVFSGHRESGYYLTRDRAAHWDGKNDVGEPVANGVYIYELTTPTFNKTRKMVILK